MFALVDCNNFYASCERVFNPALQSKPIVILSNNDGCIIARSNEAKALGVPMGIPFYQVRHLCLRHHIRVFSANFALYGDFSQRVMDILQHFCPTLEVYSIDEAFLQLNQFNSYDLDKYAFHIRAKINQWIGLPVSIGIAPTKTLAKIANHIAKNRQAVVFNLSNEFIKNTILKDFAVEEIWGVGNRLAKKLHALGIKTAAQLASSQPKLMRKKFGVMMERIILELQGISCLSLETMQSKKSIMSSRSFGKAVTELNDLAEAVSHYAARACFKLREQQAKTSGIYVYIRTSRYSIYDTPYQQGASLNFVEPTSDTCQIIQAAKTALKQIFISGYRYKKAGIILLDVLQDSYQQHDMFIEKHKNAKKDQLMQVIDKLNNTMGDNTIFLAAQGVERSWQMRSANKSPHYTTNWQELVQVQC
jgi:DNA polymerase V